MCTHLLAWMRTETQGWLISPSLFLTRTFFFLKLTVNLAHRGSNHAFKAPPFLHPARLCPLSSFCLSPLPSPLVLRHARPSSLCPSLGTVVPAGLPSTSPCRPPCPEAQCSPLVLTSSLPLPALQLGGNCWVFFGGEGCFLLINLFLIRG